MDMVVSVVPVKLSVSRNGKFFAINRVRDSQGLAQFGVSFCLSRAIRQLRKRYSSQRSRATITSANRHSAPYGFLRAGSRRPSALAVNE